MAGFITWLAHTQVGIILRKVNTTIKAHHVLIFLLASRDEIYKNTTIIPPANTNTIAILNHLSPSNQLNIPATTLRATNPNEKIIGVFVVNIINSNTINLNKKNLIIGYKYYLLHLSRCQECPEILLLIQVGSLYPPSII